MDITLYGVMHGMGDKILPSGCVLNMNNTCDFHSELVIEDGAILNYAGQLIGDSIRNHGMFNWISGHINACRSVEAAFINEADGEIVIPEWSERWLTRTNLTNYGLISKTGSDVIRFNIGCGNDGFFNNVSPGVVNLTAGTLILDGDGAHSGMFNNSGILAFNADHLLTTADNITGSGDIVIYDTTTINIPYNFPAAEISLFGTVLGMGDKTLPSGSILNVNGATWNVDGELEIADGAVVNYSGHILSNMVRNHGVINWLAYHINGCTPELSTIINESDGELVIPEWSERWLIRTNLTNYGLISKTGADQIRFNIGCGDDGFFNNISPGVVDIDAGNLILDGDGTHSGQFNNEGLLLFNADHLLTTSGNVAGSGNWHIYDTTTINIPYTIAIDSTSVYGALGGSGDITLPSGNVLNSYYLLSGTGDLNVLDGGTLHFLNNHTNYFSYEIHNHGLVTWNEGYYLNNWDPVTNFINEPDGELQIGGIGDGNNTRSWLKTNLENHGVINMNTPANVSMEGCCGGMAYLNNNSPGAINVLDGNLILMSNGEHSGTFNVTDRMRFEAEHLLTANGNITGSGKFTSGGITTMDVPYTFAIDSVEVYGTITSMEDLTLPSGSTLSFTHPGSSYLTAPFQNHGTVYWNIGVNLNPCSTLSVFTNASDGEFIMGGTGDRYFGNTHLINNGLIIKDTDATIHMNEDGSCGGTAGMFDNIGPGMLNVLQGIFLVR